MLYKLLTLVVLLIFCTYFVWTHKTNSCFPGNPKNEVEGWFILSLPDLRRIATPWTIATLCLTMTMPGLCPMRAEWWTLRPPNLPPHNSCSAQSRQLALEVANPFRPVDSRTFRPIRRLKGMAVGSFPQEEVECIPQVLDARLIRPCLLYHRATHSCSHGNEERWVVIIHQRFIFCMFSICSASFPSFM